MGQPISVRRVPTAYPASEVSRLRAYSVVVGALQSELSLEALEAVFRQVESGALVAVAA